MMPPVLKQRRIDPARALLLCGLLSILASGCPDPYTFGDRLYSVPWGSKCPFRRELKSSTTGLRSSCSPPGAIGA